MSGSEPESSVTENPVAASGEDSAQALLRQGRDAFLRGCWSEAYEALTQAGAQGELDPGDLDALGQAAYYTCRLEESIRHLEAAFAGYTERGDKRAAAMVAMWGLSVAYWDKGLASVGEGWDRRAARLVEDEPECVEQGWIAYGLGDADRALELARQFGDRSLEARCLHDRARALIEAGQLDEGLAMIDEICVSVAAGEIRPYHAAALYCLTTMACVGVADYRRARDWSEVSRRHAAELGPNFYSSLCRVHRAEIMNAQGSWEDAEREALTAISELGSVDQFTIGLAFREVGEIRLKRGDLVGAEEALREAHNHGTEPQPGLALLRLAQGNPESALALINRALEEEGNAGRTRRARLLRAQVTISLEAGDRATAESAVAALDTITSDYGTAAMLAAQADARGDLRIAVGDVREAVPTYRSSHRLWLEAGAPYEAARAQLRLGAAFIALGETEPAMLELNAAQAVFERLGAAPDVEQTVDLLRRANRASTPQTAVRTLIFTDIVGSTELIGVIGDGAWEDVRRWHDESLRRCFEEHGGEEIDHAGDGFFVAFPEPGLALRCSIGIQRDLAEHRRAHGFAPEVRIGVHAAEATHSGRQLTGRGVHAAARIAALANGGEILVSIPTLDGLDGFTTGETRTVALKGFTEPIQVAALDWH